MAIPGVLRSLGADPARVLADVGLPPDLFEDADNRISFVARGRLVSRCVAATGCRHFGLLVGKQSSLQSLGLIGMLARHSPDLRTALGALVGFFHVHALGATLNLTVDDEFATFSYAVYQPRLDSVDQTGDGAVAMMANILRELCGPRWRAVEVRFAHRKPQDVGPFQRHFRAPLVFNAGQYGVVFPTDWMQRPLPDSEANLHRLLKAQIEALAARHRDDLPSQVSSMLSSALLTGHAGADQVAAIFSMHSRTLSRRLLACGTHFQALVDEGRFEIARRLLEDTTTEISEIAASLHYADASAFTRAFRRWSGTTPSRWRAGNGRGS